MELAPYIQALPLPRVLKSKKVKGVDVFTLVMKRGTTQCHPDIKFATDITGYASGVLDAPIFPGPMLVARRGKPSIIRVINNISENDTYTKRVYRPVLHLHGAVASAENAGHPTQGVPYDGGTRDYYFTNDQPGAMLWYHDNTPEYSGQRTHNGLAGLYMISDPAESRLKLPKGKYDIPLMIQDRAFLSSGMFEYDREKDPNLFVHGLFGDLVLVNGVYAPYLEVEATKYRFRMVNGSNSRFYDLKFENGASFVVIGSDGGLLQKPRTVNLFRLGTGERADIIMDFSQFPVGAEFLLLNELGAETRSARIMQFRIVKKGKPSKPLPETLMPFVEIPEKDSVGIRDFYLRRETVGSKMRWTLDHKIYNRSSPPIASPVAGTVEHWRFTNPTIHEHPMHLQGIPVQIVNINGVPQEASDFGRKDSVIVPALGELTVAVKFDTGPGKYFLSCNILEHTDDGMGGDIEVVAAS